MCVRRAAPARARRHSSARPCQPWSVRSPVLLVRRGTVPASAHDGLARASVASVACRRCSVARPVDVASSAQCRSVCCRTCVSAPWPSAPATAPCAHRDRPGSGPGSPPRGASGSAGCAGGRPDRPQPRPTGRAGRARRAARRPGRPGPFASCSRRARSRPSAKARTASSASSGSTEPAASSSCSTSGRAAPAGHRERLLGLLVRGGRGDGPAGAETPTTSASSGRQTRPAVGRRPSRRLQRPRARAAYCAHAATAAPPSDGEHDEPLAVGHDEHGLAVRAAAVSMSVGELTERAGQTVRGALPVRAGHRRSVGDGHDGRLPAPPFPSRRAAPRPRPFAPACAVMWNRERFGDQHPERARPAVRRRAARPPRGRGRARRRAASAARRRPAAARPPGAPASAPWSGSAARPPNARRSARRCRAARPCRRRARLWRGGRCRGTGARRGRPPRPVR